MRFSRTLTLLLSTALLGLPALVFSGAPATAAGTTATHISMQLSQKKMVYRTAFSISGELLQADGTPVPGTQTINLERRNAGSSTWVALGTYAANGTYTFYPTGKQNSSYRVRYDGDVAFRFRMAAPRIGSWYYRAVVASSTQFVTSYSQYTYRTYMLDCSTGLMTAPGATQSGSSTGSLRCLLLTGHRPGSSTSAPATGCV